MQNSTYAPSTWLEMQANKIVISGKGIAGTAAANATTNIDLALTDDAFIKTIQLNVNNPNAGDNFDFQAIDKDNILGFGANFVVRQPITAWGLCATQDFMIYQIPVPNKAPAGLYLRLVYRNVSLLTPVQVGLNYDLLLPTV